MSKGQLTRSRTNRIIGGVAGGISEYTGIDCGIVRIVTALACFTGAGLAAYIVAWIILPEEGSSTTGLDSIMGAFSKGTSNDNDKDYR